MQYWRIWAMWATCGGNRQSVGRDPGDEHFNTWRNAMRRCAVLAMWTVTGLALLMAAPTVSQAQDPVKTPAPPKVEPLPAVATPPATSPGVVQPAPLPPGTVVPGPVVVPGTRVVPGPTVVPAP